MWILVAHRQRWLLRQYVEGCIQPLREWKLCDHYESCGPSYPKPLVQSHGHGLDLSGKGPMVLHHVVVNLGKILAITLIFCYPW